MLYLQALEKKIYIEHLNVSFMSKIADSRALEHKQTIIYFSAVSYVTRHTTQLFYYDYKYFILAHRKLHYIAITKQGDGEQNTKLN